MRGGFPRPVFWAISWASRLRTQQSRNSRRHPLYNGLVSELRLLDHGFHVPGDDLWRWKDLKKIARNRI